MKPSSEVSYGGLARWRGRWIRIVIPCLAGLAGVAAGWLLKPDSPARDANGNETGAVVRSSVGKAKGNAAPHSPDATAAETAVARLARTLQAAEKLSPQEFGERMAELLSKPTFGEVLVERGIMISLLDGERMAAVYEAHKRRTGATALNEQQELRDLLLAAGQKDGKGTMERLLTLHPDGFSEMGSVTYGWALTSPREAVDWLNSLPEESMSRKRTLRGLMSGLAAGNGDLAGKVLASLAPEDKPEAALGFANSMIQNHGLEQFDRWLDAADPEVAKLAIQQSSFRSEQQPPPDLVPWLVRHAEVVGPDRLNSAFRKWTRSDPDAAIEWLFNQSPDPSRPDPLLAGLTEANPDAVNQWVNRHPNHPAARARQQQDQSK